MSDCNCQRFAVATLRLFAGLKLVYGILFSGLVLCRCDGEFA